MIKCLLKKPNNSSGSIVVEDKPIFISIKNLHCVLSVNLCKKMFLELEQRCISSELTLLDNQSCNTTAALHLVHPYFFHTDKLQMTFKVKCNIWTVIRKQETGRHNLTRAPRVQSAF